jgi:hypothetical protein
MYSNIHAKLILTREHVVAKLKISLVFPITLVQDKSTLALVTYARSHVENIGNVSGESPRIVRGETALIWVNCDGVQQHLLW